MKKTLLKRKYNPKAHFASEVDTSGNEKDGCVARHRRIAERAYEIYRLSDYIQGRSETNWFQAEDEVNNRKQ